MKVGVIGIVSVCLLAPWFAPAAGQTAELQQVWRSAAVRLQQRPDVRALGLTPAQLDTLTAVFVDGTGAIDLADIAGRMAAVKQDADAWAAVDTAWRSASPYEVRRLVARAYAAMARTEHVTVGGRAATAENRDRARQFAAAAVALAPGNPDAHLALADVLADEAPDAAEAEYRKALAARPGVIATRVRLAEAIRMQGRFGDAMTELRDIIRVSPGTSKAHADLGMILREQKDLAGAAAAYREAIRLDRDSSDAHNGLAITLARQGRLEEAVAEFREMIRIDPDSAIAHYNLAYALADLDRDVESAAALREVIRINPNHYNARYNLGELFRMEGKFDESAKQFREYLRLAPDTAQNRRNITRARDFVSKFEEPAADRP